MKNKGAITSMNYVSKIVRLRVFFALSCSTLCCFSRSLVDFRHFEFDGSGSTINSKVREANSFSPAPSDTILSSLLYHRLLGTQYHHRRYRRCLCCSYYIDKGEPLD
jgi:hypothetical protein